MHSSCRLCLVATDWSVGPLCWNMLQLKCVWKLERLTEVADKLPWSGELQTTNGPSMQQGKQTLKAKYWGSGYVEVCLKKASLVKFHTCMGWWGGGNSKQQPESHAPQAPGCHMWFYHAISRHCHFEGHSSLFIHVVLSCHYHTMLHIMIQWYQISYQLGCAFSNSMALL